MAKLKINNIVAVKLGIVAYNGFLDASWSVDGGDYLPNMDEGDLYPKGADNVGTPGRFPVTGSLNSEDISNALVILTSAAGSLKISGKAAGAGVNRGYVCANALFNTLTISASRQQDARVTLGFMGYSVDGTTHPYSETTADAAGGTKKKTNNIASLVHTNVPSPGIMGVDITINRGNYLPNMDEGQPYPKGADLVGSNTYPVTWSVRTEDATSAAKALAAIDTLVLTLAAAQAAANQVITLSNAQPNRGSGAIRRQQDGSFTVSGFCYSANGSTLPITIADAV